MRYAVIGTGAIGGYYGARLAQSGQEVHFLFRSDYEYVKAHGLQVDSCDGSFHLDHVNAYNNTADMPPCDVILVCLKSVNNNKLRDLLPPLLNTYRPTSTTDCSSSTTHHPSPIVILIQNGIGVEADVQQMFPDVQLVAGLAFICSAKTEPGRVNHQCYGQINLAPYPNPFNPSGLSNLPSLGEGQGVGILSDFNAAGIKAGLVEYHEARWKKAVWNMPFNGMTVALNTQTDLLLKNPATRQLIKDQMMEVIGAARHLGVQNIDESFADKMIQMTDDMVPYSPSMKLDYDYHRRMEIYYLYTRPIQIAREAGFAMPKLEMLEAMLRFLSGLN
jgi:2-dehydropantoate 2-reductase